MAACRVYLFTYNRNNLLPRAVNSLTSQTFTDWVCELHNDAPENDYPEQYIASLNDDRFIVKKHTENLGAVESFNVAFTGCNEGYASLLEDDNWWEPDFLETMIQFMDDNPACAVAWSNMRLWQETAAHHWVDTGKTIWPIQSRPVGFCWPAPQQAMNALHSTGAMLYRGSHAHRFTVPAATLLNAVELVRERSFKHPVYLISKPLANFAITRATSRSADPLAWIAAQVMLLASYLMQAPHLRQAFKESLHYYRKQRPTPIANFMLAIIFYIRKPSLLRYFNVSDWFACLKWLARNAYQLNRLKQILASQQQVFQYLLTHTAERYSESSARFKH